MATSCDSEAGRLRRVALAAPTHYRQTAPINRRQEREAAGAPVSRARLEDEHAQLRARLIEAGVDVVDLEPSQTMPYLLNVRDVAVAVGPTLVACEMGEPVRRGEPAWVLSQLDEDGYRRDLPHGEGDTLEGGDVFLVADELLVGLSQRTTRGGAEAILAGTGRTLNLVQLGDGILHMDTVLNVVGDLAVVAPAAIGDVDVLYATLGRLGVTDVVEVDVAEADEFATNFLCLDERHVLIAETCVTMRATLESKGIASTTVEMSEHHRIGGSVRCATLPLERDARTGTA